MEEQPKRRGRPPKGEMGFRKTDDITRYNREYKKLQYEKDSEKYKKLRSFYNYRNNYEIPQKWIDKYHEDIAMAVALKELHKKMGDELFNKIVEDLGEMDFPKKNKN
jgi:hypothetical protein